MAIDKITPSYHIDFPGIDSEGYGMNIGKLVADAHSQLASLTTGNMEYSNELARTFINQTDTTNQPTDSLKNSNKDSLKTIPRKQTKQNVEELQASSKIYDITPTDIQKLEWDSLRGKLSTKDSTITKFQLLDDYGMIVGYNDKGNVKLQSTNKKAVDFFKKIVEQWQLNYDSVPTDSLLKNVLSGKDCIGPRGNAWANFNGQNLSNEKLVEWILSQQITESSAYKISDFNEFMNDLYQTNHIAHLKPMDIYSKNMGNKIDESLDNVMNLIHKRGDANFYWEVINPSYHTLYFTESPKDPQKAIRVGIAGDINNEFRPIDFFGEEANEIKDFLRDYITERELDVSMYTEMNSDINGQVIDLATRIGESPFEFKVNDDYLGIVAKTGDKGGPAFFWWAAYALHQTLGNIPPGTYDYSQLDAGQQAALKTTVNNLFEMNMGMKDQWERKLAQYYGKDTPKSRVARSRLLDCNGYDPSKYTKAQQLELVNKITDWWVYEDDVINVAPLEGMLGDMEASEVAKKLNEVGWFNWNFIAANKLQKEQKDYTDKVGEETLNKAKDYTDEKIEGINRKLFDFQKKDNNTIWYFGGNLAGQYIDDEQTVEPTTPGLMKFNTQSGYLGPAWAGWGGVEDKKMGVRVLVSNEGHNYRLVNNGKILDINDKEVGHIIEETSRDKKLVWGLQIDKNIGKSFGIFGGYKFGKNTKDKDSRYNSSITQSREGGDYEKFLGGVRIGKKDKFHGNITGSYSTNVDDRDPQGYQLVNEENPEVRVNNITEKILSGELQIPLHKKSKLAIGGSYKIRNQDELVNTGVPASLDEAMLKVGAAWYLGKTKLNNENPLGEGFGEVGEDFTVYATYELRNFQKNNRKGGKLVLGASSDVGLLKQSGFRIIGEVSYEDLEHMKELGNTDLIHKNNNLGVKIGIQYNLN